MSDAVSPGGPRASAIKKRRLAALEKSRAAQGQAIAKQTGRPSADPPAACSAQQAWHQPSNTAPPPCPPPTQQPQPPASPHRSGNGTGVARGNSQKGVGPRLWTGGRGDGGGRRSSQGSDGGGVPGRATTRGDAQGGGQGEGGHQVYARLDAELASGPVAHALQLPEPADGHQVVGQLLEGLIRTNASRGLDARSCIGLKVSDRALLLENPAVAAGRPRAGKRRLSDRLASKKEQRRQGLYAVEASGVTYDQVQPLHQRWRQYIGALLATAAGSAGGARRGGAAPAAAATAAEAQALLGADLHGCLVQVASSCEARCRGVAGVVVRDTANTLVVVTPESRVVTLPKRLCVFRYALPGKNGGGRFVELLGRTMVPQKGGSRRGSRGGRGK